MHGGRLRTAWRLIAGAALGLLILGVYWPGRLPGAQIGIDVLLVAAGALLAHALLIDRERSLADFGSAVVRLILPALLVLVAVTVGIQRWFEVPAWEAVLSDTRLAAVAVINFHSVAATSPVAWFWVIALVVQSLLLVLIVRVVQARRGTKAVVLLLGALTLVSFAGWWFVGADAQAAARFWPVGVGALLAVAMRQRSVPPWPAAVLCAVTGVVVGAYAVIGSPGQVAVPAGVLAGAVLVGSGGARLSPALLLGERLTGFLAWVAWVAFGAAWPALQLATAALGRELGLRGRLELLALVLVASIVAMGLVHGLLAVAHGRIWHPALVIATVAASVLVTVAPMNRLESIEADADRVDALLAVDVPACFGAVTMGALIEGRECDNPDLDGTIHREPARMSKDFESFIECWSQPHDADLNICDLGQTEGVPRVLVLGDSHARVMLGAFRRLAEHGVLSVSAATKASCAWSTLPIKDKADPLRVPLCDQWRSKLADWLEQHATEYDAIITTAYGGRMKGPKGARVDGLVQAWTPSAEAGVPIVAMRDNPRLPGDPNECLMAAGPQNWAECDVAAAVALAHFDAFGAAANRVEGAHYVDVSPFYCDDQVCPLVIGGVGVYRDYNHVSATYAKTLAPSLYRALARTGVFADLQQSAATAALQMRH